MFVFDGAADNCNVPPAVPQGKAPIAVAVKLGAVDELATAMVSVVEQFVLISVTTTV